MYTTGRFKDELQVHAQARSESLWQDRFLTLLPAIQRGARYAFRHLSPEAKEEATQAVIAHAVISFRTLVEQGREEIANSSSLCRFAIAHYRTGRHAANRMNSADVTSARCRYRHGIRVERLSQYSVRSEEWQELLVEDRKATPADVAATRIDFEAWLSSLAPRLRSVAEVLATGETTSAAAMLFKVTAGRISQLRRVLQRAWDEFQQDRGADLALKVA